MPTLLIAHPDETLRSEAGDVLRAEGHEVIAVETGEEAVARSVDTEAEVALVSSHFADQEGRDVCRLLREAPGGPEMGVLAIGPELWEPGVGSAFVRDAGVDGFVALPCRRSTLLAAVHSVLDRSRRRTPLPSDAVMTAVDELFDALDSKDYYALLGIERDADEEAITEALHRVSAHYHPDRHHIARQTPLYDRVRAVYKRMTEAYNALSDPEARVRYDAGLEAGELRLKPSAQEPWGAAADVAISDENARRFFELGEQAESRGDARAARMNYAFALTYERDNSALLEAVARTEDALGIPEERRTQTSRLKPEKARQAGAADVAPAEPADDAPPPDAADEPPSPDATDEPADDPPAPAAADEPTDTAPAPEEDDVEDRTETVPGRPLPTPSDGRTKTSDFDYIVDLGDEPGPEPGLPPDLPEALPSHIAMIMDGNGRWAAARGLPRLEGHRVGADSVRTVTRACRRWGIRYLTLYAFSAQNWGRPTEEVDGLMELLARFIESEREELLETGVRLVTMGDLSRLPAEVRAPLVRLIVDTKDNRTLTLCLALSYGGREEILSAARKVAEKAARGDLDPAALDAESFRAFLDRPDVPDPDLVIRTSGEMRLSNFLLWQIAYAELWVTPTLWPDFGEPELLEALQDFAGRDRRFGRLDEGEA